MTVVPRILVFWTHPHHLAEQEANDWIRRESRRLLAAEGVRGARLTRLRSASDRHPRIGDWMLELHVAPGTEDEGRPEAGAYEDWLGDLTLLGMCPSIALADDDTDHDPAGA